MANPEYVIAAMPDLYVIPYGSGGNNPVADNALDLEGWTQLGSPADDGEVGFAYSPTFHRVRQQAFSSTLRAILIAEELKLAAKLSESNLAQLRHLLAAGTYVDGSFAAVKATGFIQLVSNDPQTITVKGVLRSLVAGAPNAGEIQLQASIALTVAHVASELEADADVDLDALTYTDDGTDKIEVEAKVAGVAGNAITLAASEATVSGATLSGGAAAGSIEDVLSLGDGAVAEYSLAMVIPRAISGANNELVIFIPKVWVSGGMALPFAKQKTSDFDIEWEAMTDPTENAGKRLAYLIELTNAA